MPHTVPRLLLLVLFMPLRPSAADDASTLVSATARRLEAGSGLDALPDVDPAWSGSLLAISLDPARPGAERAAALVLTVPSTEERLDREFRSIWEDIRPMHVHPAEMFISRLEALTFTEADLPGLARRALLRKGDGARAPVGGMAIVALGLVDDPRSLDVLLVAPGAWIGDRGSGDAVFHGLALLARSAARRDELAAWAAGDRPPDPRRTRAVLVLANLGDERAALPFARLLRALAEAGPDERRAPALLPEGFLPSELHRIAAAWKDPRLGPAVLESVYARVPGIEGALAAAKACGAAPDPARLWPLLEGEMFYSDRDAVLKALAPLLDEDDTPRVVALLGRDHWRDDNFYLRILWAKDLPAALRTGSLRDALLELAAEHPNPPLRDWAIEALGGFDDARAAEALEAFARSGGSQATAALRQLLARAADPWPILRDAFTGADAPLAAAARKLLAIDFSNPSAGLPFDPTGAQKRELADSILIALPGATPEAAESLLEALFALLAARISRHAVARDAAFEPAVLRALEPATRGAATARVESLAASCLWQLGGDGAARALDRLASESPHESVRRFATDRAAELRR